MALFSLIFVIFAVQNIRFFFFNLSKERPSSQTLSLSWGYNWSKIVQKAGKLRKAITKMAFMDVKLQKSQKF